MSFQKNEYSHKNVSEDNNGQGGNPPIASPLNDQQFNSLQQTVSELSSQQLAWVSGYFWGLAQHQPSAAQHQSPKQLPQYQQSLPVS